MARSFEIQFFKLNVTFQTSSPVCGEILVPDLIVKSESILNYLCVQLKTINLRSLVKYSVRKKVVDAVRYCPS